MIQKGDTAVFYGRETELAELNQLYQTSQFQMPVIYGRRRVGKSTLIRKFTEDKKAILFTAIESTAEKNLMHFSRCIYHTLMPDIPSLPPFQSFEDAFDFLSSYVNNQRLIVAIDEYPYLAASNKEISSLLQSYIDNQWKNSQMYLILCGSSMSFMEHQILGYKSPLYGRRSIQIKLLPFDYKTASFFVPEYTPEEKAVVYGVTGGIPRYLELFDPAYSVYENIIQLFFTESGYLFEEPSNLLKQELRDVSTYNAVIEALACGASKVNELVTETHTDTAVVSYCLKSLISIGIVQKEYAITDENNKKKTHYTICDNMFCFWYRFVPNGTEWIRMHYGQEYFKEAVMPCLNDYMGKIFEQMCRHYLMQISLEGAFQHKVMKIGRWWGTNPKLKREEEIDIVGINPLDHFLLLGECKYQNSGIHLDTAEQLIERGSFISGYPMRQYVLCSKNYFTQAAQEYANANAIQLITLDDLYANSQ